MPFFVAVNEEGEFLTNRKATNHMYVSRSTWMEGIENAKIFSTKAAATRSGNDNGECEFWVEEVEVRLKDE